MLFGSGAFSMPGLMGAACGDRFGATTGRGALGFVTIFIGVGQALGPYVGGTLADAFSSFGPSYLVAAGVFCRGGGRRPAPRRQAGLLVAGVGYIPGMRGTFPSFVSSK